MLRLLAAGGLGGLGLAALQGRRSSASPDAPGPDGGSRLEPPPATSTPTAATPSDAPANDAPASAATPTSAEPPRGPTLSPAQLAALAAIQQQLLPAADGCPGAEAIGSTPYLQGTFADPRTAPEDITTVIDGLAELERLASQRHQQSVAALSPPQLQGLLRLRQADDDGAAWLGVLLVFTLEALLGDPVYGGNLGERGWQWLGLHGAAPRPSQRWYHGQTG